MRLPGRVQRHGNPSDPRRFVWFAFLQRCLRYVKERKCKYLTDFLKIFYQTRIYGTLNETRLENIIWLYNKN